MPVVTPNISTIKTAYATFWKPVGCIFSRFIVVELCFGLCDQYGLSNYE